jgi:hypothetical protein
MLLINYTVYQKGAGAVKKKSLRHFFITKFIYVCFLSGVAGYGTASGGSDSLNHSSEDAQKMASKWSNKVACHCETCTYRFELVESKNDAVCKQMGDVYNGRFSRMFDDRGFSDKERLKNRTKLLMSYPASPEYEAIEWQYPEIFVYKDKDEKPYALAVAKIDIDNDGTNEIVIREGGTFYGPKSPLETFYIYGQGEFDSSKITTSWELAQGQDPEHPPRIVSRGHYLRPFIFNGDTYLSNYSVVFDEVSGEYINTCAPPPQQRMLVSKYIQGTAGRNYKYKIEESPMVFEEVCEFNMIRTEPCVNK